MPAEYQIYGQCPNCKVYLSNFVYKDTKFNAITILRPWHCELSIKCADNGESNACIPCVPIAMHCPLSSVRPLCSQLQCGQYLFNRPVALIKSGKFLVISHSVFKHFAHNYNVVNNFSLSLPNVSSTCAFFGPQN